MLRRLRYVQIFLKKRDDFSIVARFRVLIPAAMSIYLTPIYDTACSFVRSGVLCTVSGMYLVG